MRCGAVTARQQPTRARPPVPGRQKGLTEAGLLGLGRLAVPDPQSAREWTPPRGGEGTVLSNAWCLTHPIISLHGLALWGAQSPNPVLFDIVFTHKHKTNERRSQDNRVNTPPPPGRNLIVSPGCGDNPGISHWPGRSIQGVFHSLCPLGLITINLTPCLSDAAVRSAGLGETLTKAPGGSAL